MFDGVVSLTALGLFVRVLSRFIWMLSHDD